MLFTRFRAHWPATLRPARRPVSGVDTAAGMSGHDNPHPLALPGPASRVRHTLF